MASNAIQIQQIKQRFIVGAILLAFLSITGAGNDRLLICAHRSDFYTWNTSHDH